MKHSGFRRWMWLGGAASALVLSVGCGRMSRSGGGDNSDQPQLTLFGSLARDERGGDPNRFHVPADRGYNGTIAQLGSSIDPRTPEKLGTPGRTRLTDVTGYMGRPDIAQNYPYPPTSLGIGGSGSVDPVTGAQETGWRTRPGTTPQPQPQPQGEHSSGEHSSGEHSLPEGSESE